MTHATRRVDRAVVFDLDETLHRLRRFTVGGYAHVARWLASRTGRRRGSVFRRLWGLYRGGRGATAYQTVCAELGLPPSSRPRCCDIIVPTCRRLRLTRSADFALRQMRGTWRVGVLTNGMPELQRIKVAALGLEPRVDAIVYADELVPGGKPAPEVFERIADDLGVRARTLRDGGRRRGGRCPGGHAAGMRTIWLRRPNRPSPPKGTADAMRAVAVGIAGDRGTIDRGLTMIAVTEHCRPARWPPTRRLFAVAEIGLNHGGDVERALAMVDAAAQAGACAVKLQSLVADRLVASSCPAPMPT